MDPEVRLIKTEALKSRLLLILLQYIANILIPDHNAQVFQFTKTTENYGPIDKTIFHLFGGFLRWDAHYFVHIAIYGYTYENTLAFFPLLPFFIGVTGRVLANLFPFISIESIVLLLYVTFNVIIFQLATAQLYKLSNEIFNSKFAYKVAVLFCYNPASIFFIAPYTECLYSYLTFRIILSCLVLYKCYEKCPPTFTLPSGKVIIETGLSTVVRSNGILNIGFIVFTFICLMRNTFPLSNVISKCIHAFKFSCIIFVYSILSAVPFLLYQLYCYLTFCVDFDYMLPKNVKEYATSQSYVLPGEFSKHNQSWCYKHLPLAYSYVQEHYWNVGLLRYYELKQIPNFLLAAPVIILLLKKCGFHLYKNLNRNIFSIFVLKTPILHKNCEKINMLHPTLNVFVIHAIFLTIFCVLVIHIQVSTRMLCSASPVLYWYCAHYISEGCCTKHIFFCSYSSFTELFVKVYFLGYFIGGTTLFCNFLPWT